jgi:hypothetical protein
MTAQKPKWAYTHPSRRRCGREIATSPTVAAALLDDVAACLPEARFLVLDVAVVQEDQHHDDADDHGDPDLGSCLAHCIGVWVGLSIDLVG